MRRILFLPIALLLAASAAGADSKRPLTHDDYDGWRSLSGTTFTLDGRFAAWSEEPQQGDAELVVVDVETGRTFRHPRGESPRFSSDGRFVVFRLQPPFDDVRTYEYEKLKKAREKKKGQGRRGRRGSSPTAEETGTGATPAEPGEDAEDEEPKPALCIMDLATGEVRTVPRLKRFHVPEEGPPFLIYELEPEKKEREKPAGPDASEEAAGESKPASEPPGGAQAARAPEKASPPQGEREGEEEEEKELDRPYRKDGAPLVVERLETGDRVRIEGVTTWGAGDKNGWIWYARSSKRDDPEIARGMFARHLESGREVTLVEGAAEFRSFATDHEETRLAFLSNRRDRDAEKPTFDLVIYDFGDDAVRSAVSHADLDFPAGTCVSEHRAPVFCRDGGVLLFWIADLPQPDPDPILPDEKVTLDLWHYRDGLLQPMQARRAERERESSLAAAWHVDSSRMQVLSAHRRESVRFITDDGSKALVTDETPYEPLISWDRTYRDVYLVNTIDGTRREVLEKSPSRPQVSPDGRYLVFAEDGDHHAVDLARMTQMNLTRDIETSFVREDWDTPSEPRAYGVGGFVSDGRHVLLYDRFDIWRVALDGSGFDCVTDGLGRVERVRLRVVRLDDEERTVPAEGELLLSAFSEDTMASGYFVDRLDAVTRPREVVMLDRSFGSLRKPKHAERLFFTLQSFEHCPDLWTSGPDFQDRVRLSDLNPQQADVRWGTAELVHFRSLDGEPLKGILIKPEGFDPSRRHPMLVYFYERMSETLHRYRAPAPGTSPNPTFYASNGYLVFMPDIRYRIGYPGESCLKCVVPGVQSLVAQGFVDENGIGAAGHSWGGYQTAYLITRTDIFAAVESGAPVSNMTSAYGGIRWSSGMSRAFQYERTQSRIGATLWEAPMRYLENSPLFAADRVRTPILMLHNDQDGAVPWYQGIEYFCALRRLGKEAYLFNYNGQAHGLRRRADQMDWTMRMFQYFEHHLRGRERPDWMEHGVPYVEREDEKRTFRPPWKPPKIRPEAAAEVSEVGS